MMQPNAALIRFHKKHCPELPIDSIEVFYKLLDELNKIKGAGVDGRRTLKE